MAGCSTFLSGGYRTFRRRGKCDGVLSDDRLELGVLVRPPFVRHPVRGLAPHVKCCL